MWTAMFDPIENSGSARPQQLHIVGEKCQTDWKHPESHDRQEPQQQAHWNPEPATERLPEEANG
jgi:hypothetical protein